MAAAVQPNSLGTLRKHFTKPSQQVAAPLCRKPHFSLFINLIQTCLDWSLEQNPSLGVPKKTGAGLRTGLHGSKMQHFKIQGMSVIEVNVL